MVGKERARCRKEEEDEQHGREVWKEGRYGGAREVMEGGAIGGCGGGGGGGGRGGAATGRRAGGSYERERVWGEVMANKIQTFGSISSFGFIA